MNFVGAAPRASLLIMVTVTSAPDDELTFPALPKSAALAGDRCSTMLWSKTPENVAGEDRGGGPSRNAEAPDATATSASATNKFILGRTRSQGA